MVNINQMSPVISTKKHTVTIIQLKGHLDAWRIKLQGFKKKGDTKMIDWSNHEISRLESGIKKLRGNFVMAKKQVRKNTKKAIFREKINGSELNLLLKLAKKNLLAAQRNKRVSKDVRDASIIKFHKEVRRLEGKFNRKPILTTIDKILDSKRVQEKSKTLTSEEAYSKIMELVPKRSVILHMGVEERYYFINSRSKAEFNEEALLVKNIKSASIAQKILDSGYQFLDPWLMYPLEDIVDKYRSEQIGNNGKRMYTKNKKIRIDKKVSNLKKKKSISDTPESIKAYLSR